MRPTSPAHSDDEATLLQIAREATAQDAEARGFVEVARALRAGERDWFPPLKLVRRALDLAVRSTSPPIVTKLSNLSPRELIQAVGSELQKWLDDSSSSDQGPDAWAGAVYAINAFLDLLSLEPPDWAAAPVTGIAGIAHETEWQITADVAASIRGAVGSLVNQNSHAARELALAADAAVDAALDVLANALAGPARSALTALDPAEASGVDHLEAYPATSDQRAEDTVPLLAETWASVPESDDDLVAGWLDWNLQREDYRRHSEKGLPFTDAESLYVLRRLIDEEITLNRAALCSSLHKATASAPTEVEIARAIRWRVGSDEEAFKAARSALAAIRELEPFPGVEGNDSHAGLAR